MVKRAFLSLGTNLGDREDNLRKAVDNINKAAGEITSSSGIYETEPWGFKNDNLFYNMVIEVITGLKPVDLLKQLLQIQVRMGRVRESEKYSSRLIDIDILLYENEIVNKPYLKIPHPLIQDRKFVLVPLCEIAPGMIHPVLKKTFAELLEECKDVSAVTKIGLL